MFTRRQPARRALWRPSEGEDTYIVLGDVSHSRLFLIAAVATAILLTVATAAPQLLASSDGDGDPHLVDADGRSLYLFLRDEGGDSTCYDACAVNWPPFLVEPGEDVALGEGLEEHLVGRVDRNDGSHQVTYAGWPLYTFIGDTEPGERAGHERNDVWFLVATDGGPLGHDEAESDEAATLDELIATGTTVFTQICAACHGQRGGGGQGPRLDGNPRLADTAYIADVVLRGYGYMPPFGPQLTDAEVAGALTFIRTAWSNDFGVVTEEEVRQLR
jgi:predicted lipoprotein with Yx(FWY)xxD motif/cytochrome c5